MVSNPMKLLMFYFFFELQNFCSVQLSTFNNLFLFLLVGF